MSSKLFSTLVLSAVASAMFFSAPAEARHKRFWWLHQQPAYESDYGIYDDANFVDEQDFDVDEQFNQEQYDLYMREKRMNRRKNYDEAFYDPQPDFPKKPKVKQQKAKKVSVQKSVAAKPVPKKLAVKLVKVAVAKPVVADKKIQTGSISGQFSGAVAPQKIDCTKGAAIVSSYGFSTVTTKTCGANILTYNAVRSGKNFEIQVSAANGELTTVKRL